MSFRVPVLETFLWQKEVNDIINNPTEVTFAKGDRYIVGSEPAAGSVFENHANDIAWFDGSAWNFDTPAIGWTTIIPTGPQGLRLVVFEDDSWESFGANQFTVDGDKFVTQIPKFDNGEDVPVGTKWTLQRLLEWMDSNFGGPGPLGMPSDGTYNDGLFEWTQATRINDALDDANEALKDLAPPQAESLAGKTLTLNVTKVSTAKLAANIPNGATNWYVDGLVAGSNVTDVITTSTIKLSTPNTSNCFGRGDEGLLKVEHGTGAAASAVEAVYDISANYVEPEPGNTRFAVQDLTLWTNAGDSLANGVSAQPVVQSNKSVLAFNSGNADITILDVRKYNDFNLWQKMNAELNFKSLAAGFHQFILNHEVRGIARKTTIAKVIYDPNITDTVAVTDGQMTPTSETSTVYISGIKYYTKGTTARVEFKASNLFKNVYSATIADVTVASDSKVNFTPGGSGVNVSTIPNYDDELVVSHTIAINSTATTDNLTAAVKVYHPYKTVPSSTTIQSANQMLYTGYNGTSQSSNLIEAFKDETFRMPQTTAFDTVPSVLTGTWDSTLDLTSTNDAVVYLNSLQLNAPNISTKLPASNPNYSTKVAGQVFCRAFKSTNIPQSSVNLTMTGTGVNPLTNLAPVGSTSGWNLEIKLPGVTGWLDAGKGYDSSSFNKNVDGSGCQNQGATTSSVLALTFGGENISASGFVMFVRITINGATTKFQRIATNWS